ncbi:MAG: DUF4445 domain-containing protein [Mogibacterium sp.]|nr:DUF4445 domain-containing protein [Mogibacterium sp.]
MPNLKVMPEEKLYGFASGKNLMEIMLDAGLFIDNACGGKGLCGKCRVKITEGDAGEPGETERGILKAEELEQGVRLACLAYPVSDITIELLQKEKKHDVLASGYMPDFDFGPDIVKVPVTIHKPTLADQTPFENQIIEQVGAEALVGHDGATGYLGFDYTALREHSMLPGEYTAVIHDGKVIALEPGDTTGSLYGVAIDIGTTTVVCSLVDMLTGEELGHASEINAQKFFGLDVLTRITYEIENPEDGREKLQKAIVGSINKMVKSICDEHGLTQDQIYEVTVGANCTMMHMLMGVDARPIGKAPFAPVFARAKDIKASDIGLKAAPGARLYCLPSVSAYIGADIVAGAYVCDLKHQKGNVMFIDIGTNGEIVLAADGKLMSCSCAAGPALEGMNISSGMRAAEGAIEDIHINEDGVDLKIIGDCEPAGICGSGILTVTKELLRTGIVRKTGAFVKADKFDESDYRSKYIAVDEEGKRSFRMTDGSNGSDPLYITQGDVRQVQLAKGAILSGFMALMRKAGIGMEDLDRVLIAGQFGAHLPAESITGTGILPFEVEDRIEYVGNTSKTGAYMALMSGTVKRQMEALAHDMDYLELGATDNYERLLSECLIFPVFK